MRQNNEHPEVVNDELEIINDYDLRQRIILSTLTGEYF